MGPFMIGVSEKRKKDFRIFLLKLFFANNTYMKQIKVKKSNNSTQDNSYGGGDFHLHT